MNADFEAGFASDPEGVATNVALAVGTGVAGLSIEDGDEIPSGLYDLAFSVERVRAARAALDRSGGDVILVARTEGLLTDPDALTPAIDKLVAFAEAGADCLYAPGVRRPEDIAAMVRAGRPSPSTCWSWNRPTLASVRARTTVAGLRLRSTVSVGYLTAYPLPSGERFVLARTWQDLAGLPRTSR